MSTKSRTVWALASAGLLLASTLSVTGHAVAVPAEADSSPAAPRADVDCELVYEGYTRSGDVLGRTVRDGVVVSETRASHNIGYDIVGRSFVGTVVKTQRYFVSYHALTRAGRPIRLTLSYRVSDDKLRDVDSSRSRTRDFEARTFSSNQGFHIFAGLDNGKLERWTNTLTPSGGTKYKDPVRVLPKGSPTLDSLLFVATTKLDGRQSHLFLATTSTGKLVRLEVPVEKPGQARLRTISKSGFSGVTELSTGGCATGKWRVPVVASNPTTDSAVWTVISNFKKDLTATPTTEVTGAETGWRYEGVL